jgi:hypothetical protein
MSLVSGILIFTCIQLRPLATVPIRGTLDPTSVTCHINLTKLLRPLYPGQAPSIRRNMYNVVLVFDLARPSSLRFITNTLSMLVDRLFPVRFGIVPIVETEEGVKMAKVFYYLVQNYGRRTTMRFFSTVRTVCFSRCYHSCYVRSLKCLVTSSRWTGFVYKRNSKQSWQMKRQGGKERPCPFTVSLVALPMSSKRGYRKPGFTRNGWVRPLPRRLMVTFLSMGSTMLPMTYVAASRS